MVDTHMKWLYPIGFIVGQVVVSRVGVIARLNLVTKPEAQWALAVDSGDTKLKAMSPTDDDDEHPQAEGGAAAGSSTEGTESGTHKIDEEGPRRSSIDLVDALSGSTTAMQRQTLLKSKIEMERESSQKEGKVVLVREASSSSSTN